MSGDRPDENFALSTLAYLPYSKQKMKIISSKAHGILDYAVVVFLLAAPTLFQMEGTLCTFTYVLAGVHFALTALTVFEVGLLKIIPFKVHGLIELVVSIALAGVALWFRNNDNDLGFYFYLGLAIVILIVYLLTDFTSSARNENRVNS